MPGTSTSSVRPGFDGTVTSKEDPPLVTMVSASPALAALGTRTKIFLGLLGVLIAGDCDAGAGTSTPSRRTSTNATMSLVSFESSGTGSSTETSRPCAPEGTGISWRPIWVIRASVSSGSACAGTVIRAGSFRIARALVDPPTVAPSAGARTT